jgi:hypothetical protein
MPLFFAALALQVPPNRLRDLSERRMSFDNAVVSDARYQGQEHVYSMTFEQTVSGLYPVGRADRRYLLYWHHGEAALLLQEATGGRARTRWRLPLRRLGPSEGERSSHRFRGTLGRRLSGMRLVPARGVTKAQATRLNAVGPFVEYLHGPPDGEWWVAFVRRDGSPGPTWIYPDHVRHIPILTEEARALGMGPLAWPPGVRPTKRAADRL